MKTDTRLHALPKAGRRDASDERISRWGRSQHEGYRKFKHRFLQPAPMLFTQDHHPLWLGDLYRGRSAFLIAGGPSFAALDQAQLHQPGVLTMGLNNSAKTFRPNLWVSVDSPDHFLRSIWLDPAITKFVPICHASKFIFNSDTWEFMDLRVGDCPNVVYYKRNEHFKANQFLWEDCINWGNHKDLGGGRSVMLAALRILFILGIRRVYLLGVDFTMNETTKYHFDQDRNKGSINGNNATYRQLNARFTELRPYFEKENFLMFNCNPNSNLKSFDFLPFEDALHNVLSDYFNPTAIADEDGVVVERYGYNAFGLSRVMDADFEPRSTSDYDWETRYGAYRWDGETGFYQVRYRYLHPTLGRWLSKDPMHEKGGINLYCYVINNSVNRVDKNGLAGLTWSKPTIEDYALAYDASFTKKKYGPPKSWSGLAKRKAAELFAKGMGGLNPTLFQHYLHGGGKAYDLSSSKMIKGEAIAAVQPQIDDALTEISGQAETFGCVEPFGVYTWGDSGFSKTVREGFGSKVWVIGSAEAGISKQCGAVVICCNGKKTAYVNCDFHLYFYDQFADAAHIFGHDPAGIDVEEFIGGLQFDEIGAWGRKISKTGTSF